MGDWLGDVDLSSPKFRAAFPDGHVPIRDARGFVKLLEFGLDFLDGLDVDRLAQVREEYVVAWGEHPGGDKNIAAINEQKKRKRALIQELHVALSFEQISNYTGVPITDVLDDFQGIRKTKTYAQLLEEEQWPKHR